MVNVIVLHKTRMGASDGNSQYTIIITTVTTITIDKDVVLWQLSGWYNRLQRDDVVAEWKQVKDEMSLHVHCHVSGAHLLLDLAAEFRYHIFTKELPLVSS